MECGTTMIDALTIQGHIDCINSFVMPQTLYNTGQQLLTWFSNNFLDLLDHPDFSFSGTHATCCLVGSDLPNLDTILAFNMIRIDFYAAAHLVEFTIEI